MRWDGFLSHWRIEPKSSDDIMGTHVSRHMSNPSLHDEFSRLETRMQDLISLCSRLHLENESLKNQQGSLVEERARLIEKNELARNKVEQMIQRLKSLEAGQ